MHLSSRIYREFNLGIHCVNIVRVRTSENCGDKISARAEEEGINISAR